MAFDLSPETYAAIESVPRGWHKLKDLPPYTAFTASPRHNTVWVRGCEKSTIDGDRIEVKKLFDDTRIDSSPGITVWVD